MAPTISSVDPKSLKGIWKENRDVCTIEVTVPTGLEEVAAEECVEKLGASVVVATGRVFADIRIDQIMEVFKLRCIDNVHLVIQMEPNFGFTTVREQCFEKLYHLSETPDWRKGMRIWRKVFNYPRDPIQEEYSLMEADFATPRPDIDLRMMKNSSLVNNNLPQTLQVGNNNIDTNTGNSEKKDEQHLPNDTDSEGPRFRVTCKRTGDSHCFGSPEAARQFGAGINERFGWPVDLAKHQLEVMLYMDTDFVYVSLCLNNEPLFKRNISQYGRCNLRASICYGLVRLAAPKAGEILLDPMCGGATIPMEGSLTYKQTFHLGGDNFPKAVTRSRENINHLESLGEKMPIDVASWDCTRLPLRDQCVDIVVSDLPFGKRLGSKFDNRVLYFLSLIELARVTRVTTGRAVLLTNDRSSMVKAIQRLGRLWKQSGCTRTVNVGGLNVGVFMLSRTDLLSDTQLKITVPAWEKKKKKNDDSTLTPEKKKKVNEEVTPSDS